MFHTSPVNKLPVEILTEIFKIYAASSSPELLNWGVVALCLVRKYWNAVAKRTPELWTSINITFPITQDNLAAAFRRLQASRREEINVSIDFRDPDWDGNEDFDEDVDIDAMKESIWVQNIMTVLEGTESRWKSIKVVSEVWLPLYKLMETWTSTDLPSLQSISMERANTVFGMLNVGFDPEPLIDPMTLFGKKASFPKLRDLSLSAVHVDWVDICVGFKNLRKLEIKNMTRDVCPTFHEFAAMLSTSPQLECLDISGFCPVRAGPGVQFGGPPVPFMNLPALKEFTFGWKDVDYCYSFLMMFQIGSTLETLTLADTESGYGYGYWRDQLAGGQSWVQNSEGIFDVLCQSGMRAWQMNKNETYLPQAGFISMHGVKRLRIAWTTINQDSALIPLLGMLTELEEVELEDVDGRVLEAIAWVEGGKAMEDRRLRRVDLRWMWQERIPSSAEGFIWHLKGAGVSVSTQVAGK